MKATGEAHPSEEKQKETPPYPRTYFLYMVPGAWCLQSRHAFGPTEPLAETKAARKSAPVLDTLRVTKSQE